VGLSDRTARVPPPGFGLVISGSHRSVTFSSEGVMACHKSTLAQTGTFATETLAIGGDAQLVRQLRQVHATANCERQDLCCDLVKTSGRLRIQAL